MLIAMLAEAWAGRKQTRANTNNAYYKRGAHKAIKACWLDKSGYGETSLRRTLERTRRGA